MPGWPVIPDADTPHPENTIYPLEEILTERGTRPNAKRRLSPRPHGVCKTSALTSPRSPPPPTRPSQLSLPPYPHAAVAAWDRPVATLASSDSWIPPIMIPSCWRLLTSIPSARHHRIFAARDAASASCSMYDFAVSFAFARWLVPGAATAPQNFRARMRSLRRGVGAMSELAQVELNP